jgi:hypothetical protein
MGARRVLQRIVTLCTILACPIGTLYPILLSFDRHRQACRRSSAKGQKAARARDRSLCCKRRDILNSIRQIDRQPPPRDPKCKLPKRHTGDSPQGPNHTNGPHQANWKKLPMHGCQIGTKCSIPQSKSGPTALHWHQRWTAAEPPSESVGQRPWRNSAWQNTGVFSVRAAPRCSGGPSRRQERAGLAKPRRKLPPETPAVTAAARRMSAGTPARGSAPPASGCRCR